ncbi:GTP-binding protein Rho1 [Entophlyctis luteolus]|nr:GTP-binding protein Rho1 [Entophlyctis luteolus]
MTSLATPPRRKLVVVGDGACGKTCLLVVFSTSKFPVDYIPTVFDTYINRLAVDGQQLEFSLWDTAGQEEYDRLRPLSYPDTHVLLICFAVDDPNSLANVEDKWVPEIVHYCPRVPYILVACKADLRNDPKVISALAAEGMRPISQAKGMEVKQKIGAASYIECSARTGGGVRDVFETAARVVLSQQKVSGGGKVRGGICQNI